MVEDGATEGEDMKAYKGFNKDLKCRDFQYEVGKTYTHKGDLRLCNSGFHIVENPLDALSYYSAARGNRYAEVEADGLSDQTESDSKRVCSSLHIGAEISLKSLIDAGIKFVINKTKSGATSGESAHSATSGDYAHSATSGRYANAEALGKNSIAAAIGYGSTAKAALGNWIVLSEYYNNGNVKWVKTVWIDGEKLKANTFYALRKGKFVTA